MGGQTVANGRHTQSLFDLSGPALAARLPLWQILLGSTVAEAPSGIDDRGLVTGLVECDGIAFFSLLLTANSPQCSVARLCWIQHLPRTGPAFVPCGDCAAAAVRLVSCTQ